MEKIFAVTADLGLSQYFSEDADVRIQLKNLFERTRTVIQREKEINLEVVLLIGGLERKNPAVNLMLWGGRRELAEKLGLSFDQYLKRAQAGRVLWRYPELIELIRSGKTYVSHVGMLTAKISDANKNIFLNEIAGKTERQVRELAASVNKDGSRNAGEVTFDLRLTLTRSQIALLERAREVLSAAGRVPSDEEAVMKALEDMLEKRDPVRKAERAEKRAEKKEVTDTIGAAKHETAETMNSAGAIAALKVPAKREPIPAASKHRVILRDEGRCSFTTASGQRCGSRTGVQIDHRIPVASGGGNGISNLRLLCREHNIMAAQVLLGVEIMARYGGAET